MQGLKRHPDKFRIDPQDELQEPFPTKNNTSSFTIGIASDQDQL